MSKYFFIYLPQFIEKFYCEVKRLRKNNWILHNAFPCRSSFVKIWFPKYDTIIVLLYIPNFALYDFPVSILIEQSHYSHYFFVFIETVFYRIFDI